MGEILNNDISQSLLIVCHQMELKKAQHGYVGKTDKISIKV